MYRVAILGRRGRRPLLQHHLRERPLAVVAILGRRGRRPLRDWHTARKQHECCVAFLGRRGRRPLQLPPEWLPEVPWCCDPRPPRTAAAACQPL